MPATPIDHLLIDLVGFIHPEWDKVQMDTVAGGHVSIYAAKPAPWIDWAPLWGWVEAHRNDGLKIDTRPLVRVGDHLMFKQFATETTDGTLMHNCQEIWLNADSVGIDYYGPEYLNSVFVHEATHYRQCCAIDWKVNDYAATEEYIYDIELEAFSVQRQYLLSVGVTKGLLVETPWPELEERIRYGYRDVARENARQAAIINARKGV